ncbi:hypothetical protein NDU88_003863 [Pleurodeles waltl]|uniref:Uncharacterized protein n=1 Tax=Pleurodeles waltl TaxID=8319 RepID=A0AAV7UZN5_PLEWA|nr:hypothetical protein NDU88_003863 [Pleurodeles waltl]
MDSLSPTVNQSLDTVSDEPSDSTTAILVDLQKMQSINAKADSMAACLDNLMEYIDRQAVKIDEAERQISDLKEDSTDVRTKVAKLKKQVLAICNDEQESGGTLSTQ